MLELFPEGFEEVEGEGGLELAAYTDAAGEERLRAAFGSVEAAEAPEDWAERWREFHRGTQVGALWVGPPWEEPPEDAVAVVVDPGVGALALAEPVGMAGRRDRAAAVVCTS